MGIPKLGGFIAFLLTSFFSKNVNFGFPLKAISEAYSVLGDPSLRRRYDRNTLGRTMSAADQELTKHTFEGDSFLRGRSAFKEQFKEGSAGLSPTRGPSSRDQV